MRRRKLSTLSRQLAPGALAGGAGSGELKEEDGAGAGARARGWRAGGSAAVTDSNPSSIKRGCGGP